MISPGKVELQLSSELQLLSDGEKVELQLSSELQLLSDGEKVELQLLKRLSYNYRLSYNC